jgi:rod shape-determining protein MreD
MKSLLFFSVGILLVLLQTTFLRFPIVPDLVLVLCVYWGLYYPTVGAVLGTFVLGYSVDAVSSRLLGINAFAMSAVFLAVYLASRSIWIHHPLVSVIVVLLASLVKGLALILIWVVFLSTEGFWIGAVRNILLEAAVAATLAPFGFALLRRGQKYLEEVRTPAQ